MVLYAKPAHVKVISELQVLVRIVCRRFRRTHDKRIPVPYLRTKANDRSEPATCRREDSWANSLADVPPQRRYISKYPFECTPSHNDKCKAELKLLIIAIK
ncbi:hypothetical protein PoB_001887900 [Plakobranchus ocellatus]|uniref:Uncharacterized protein n=1 Tax=Plakobranchus ocellatus TaxID=259542 RepID=A0AAV3ZDA8_9GAST|nr:hypothetical protein PoB_001887900 [Plakobranchus ocellatus]